jgi:nucleoid DNA-binding protein
MTTEQKKLTFKAMVDLTAIDCQYHRYEVEDVLKSYYNILRQEIYKGRVVQFENLCSLRVIKPKPKRIYNFKTKTTRLSPAHPKLVVSPSVGLLDFIREQEETTLIVNKNAPNMRHQHHLGKRKDYYDPTRIEKEKELESLPLLE